MMRRLLLVFVSLIVGWVGFVHATETSFAAPRSAVQIHVYDGQPMARDATHSAFERGPPVTSYDYDATALLAQIDNTTAMVSESAQATGGDPSSIQQWQVAANTGRLTSRADELSGVLDPIARNSRTSAVLGARQGRDVLAGGGRDQVPRREPSRATAT